MYAELSNYMKMLIQCAICLDKVETFWLPSAYLPGVEVNRDHEGGSSRARPFHCTSVGLTPTITPNVGNSKASFFIFLDSVRAIPFSLI